MRDLKTILFFSIVLMSCGGSDLKLKEKELELREREIKLKEQELESKGKSAQKLPQKETQIDTRTNSLDNSNLPKSKKYVFIQIITTQPELVHTEAFYSRDILSDRSTKITDEINHVTQFKGVYVSEIKEINSEEDEYRVRDKFRSQIGNKLELVKSEFEFDVASKVLSSRAEVQRLQSQGQAKIVDIKTHVYDSYKEASLASSKIIK